VKLTTLLKGAVRKGRIEKEGKNRKGKEKEEDCDAILLRDHVGPRERDSVYF
jgi:hypothetical protein